jgi:hypothetical protein
MWRHTTFLLFNTLTRYGDRFMNWISHGYLTRKSGRYKSLYALNTIHSLKNQTKERTTSRKESCKREYFICHIKHMDIHKRLLYILIFSLPFTFQFIRDRWGDIYYNANNDKIHSARISRFNCIHIFIVYIRSLYCVEHCRNGQIAGDISVFRRFMNPKTIHESKYLWLKFPWRRILFESNFMKFICNGPFYFTLYKVQFPPINYYHFYEGVNKILPRLWKHYSLKEKKWNISKGFYIHIYGRSDWQVTTSEARKV